MIQNTLKHIQLFAIVLLTGSLFYACELNDFVYDGPPVVEFSSQYSWSSSAGNMWTAEIRGETLPDTCVVVALVGPHQNQDKEIGFFVAQKVYRDLSTGNTSLEIPQGEEGVNWETFHSTGVEGTDYQLLNNGIGIIPANSSFGKLPMATSPSSDHYIFIVLEEKDLKPSENYKILRLRIRP